MQVLVKGVEYLISTSDRSETAKPVHFVFCHKNVEGRFMNGHTSEELLAMLVDRQKAMVDKDDSISNIQALNHLRQAEEALKRRNHDKLKRRNAANTNNGISV